MTVLGHAAHGCCYSVAALQSVAIALIASTSATSASYRIRSMWSHSGDRDRHIVVDRVITKGALGNARADCRVRVPCRLVGPQCKENCRLGNGGMGSRITVCFVFFFSLRVIGIHLFFFGCLGCGGRMKSRLGSLLPGLLPGFYETRLLLCRLGC